MGKPVVAAVDKPKLFTMLAELTSNTCVSSLQHVLPSEEQQYLVPPQGTSSSQDDAASTWDIL